MWSKLPGHALGLEVGGKRKGKCKPLLKSPHSTSTEVNLKPLPLYNHLIPGKKGGKATGAFAIQAGVEERCRHKEAWGGAPGDSCLTDNKPLISTGQNPRARRQVGAD